MSKNEIHVIVEWKNGDYEDISYHLEQTFEKSFSGSGVYITNSVADATFWVKENQVDSFLSLLEDEMKSLKNRYNKLKYRLGKTSDFYTHDGDHVENAAPLA